MPAHPRSRGENSIRNVNGQEAIGSSPLTRGKLRVRATCPLIVRLIPAHAGKTASRSSSAASTAAHPRSRGENTAAKKLADFNGGSSPLTRGKLKTSCKISICRRLIPAHAGKTRRAPGLRNGTAAHPRSRGENGFLRALVRERDGSSPLTRGKPIIRPQSRRERRLIPAHAGKTDLTFLQRPSVEAHPRSRGENTDGPYGVVPRFGSSPLTRGKLEGRGACPSRCRLIPAHAGKTRFLRPPALRSAAHPRSRGENV